MAEAPQVPEPVSLSPIISEAIRIEQTMFAEPSERAFRHVGQETPEFVKEFNKGQEIQNATEFTDRLMNVFVADAGTKDPFTFTDPEGREKDIPGAPIVTRSAMIGHMEEFRKANPDDQIGIWLIDLRRFKQANDVPDAGQHGHDNRSADVIANEVAGIYTRKADALNKALEAQNKKGRVVGYRHGGDEFGLLLEGKELLEDESLIAEIQKYFSDESQGGITAIEGYFKVKDLVEDENGMNAIDKIIKSNVELKQLPAEEAFVTSKFDPNDPQAEYKQQLFWALTSHGMILNHTQINELLETTTPEERQRLIERANERTDKDYDALTDEDLTTQLDSLAKNHPELDLLVRSVKSMDTADSNMSRKFLEFADRYVYDRLFDNIVSGMSDLQIHMATQTFDALFVMDIQALKSANDKVGIIAGDNLLKDEFDTVMNYVKTNGLTNDVRIFRRGGMFVFAFKHGPDALEHAQELEKMTKEKSLYVASKAFSTGETVATSVKMSDRINMMHEDYYMGLVDRMIEQPDILASEVPNKVTLDELKTPQVFAPSYLLDPKRAEERIGKFQIAAMKKLPNLIMQGDDLSPSNFDNPEHQLLAKERLEATRVKMQNLQKIIHTISEALDTIRSKAAA